MHSSLLNCSRSAGYVRTASHSRRATPWHRVAMRAGEGAGAPTSQAQMDEAMKRAMQDPQMAARLKAMQEAMNRPEVQQQMQQMQAFMANPTLQQRMQQLREDPEFADFWKDVQTGGMQALMKYYNDPAFLQKLSGKLGDVTQVAAAQAGVATPPPGMTGAPAMPEITNLLDAAKYGDIEAVEDFIAIGKDVAMTDKENRTPLHLAAAYNHTDIARMLLEEGAPIDAKDSMDNTPLHYAAGYGRVDVVKLLLAKGSNKGAKNNKGMTAHDIGIADARNPVSQDAALVTQLKP